MLRFLRDQLRARRRLVLRDHFLSQLVENRILLLLLGKTSTGKSEETDRGDETGGLRLRIPNHRCNLPMRICNYADVLQRAQTTVFEKSFYL